MRILIMLCIAITLTCNVRAQDSAKLMPRPKSKGEYIILKDSTKLAGNVWISGDGIKLDGKPYEFSQLLGYKENIRYHAIFNGDVYNAWSLGKVQAYSLFQAAGTSTSYNPHGVTPQSRWETHNSYATYCYLKKGDGQLMPYTSQNLFSLISDNEAAVTEFNKYYKNLNQKVPVDVMFNHLKKVLVIYNGGDFVEY
jgi:hypothetical protein